MVDIINIASQFSSPRFLLHSGKGETYSILGVGKKHEIQLFGDEENILYKLYEFWERYGQESLINNPEIPFQGGIFVFLSYDLIHNFERIPLKKTHSQIPKIYAVAPEEIFIYNNETKTLFSSNFDLVKDFPAESKINVKEHKWKITESQKSYENKTQKVKEEIILGNTFQTNISQRFIAEQKSSSFEIFRNLNYVNPTPFSAYAETPFGEIISGSPERLVKLQNGILETQPIAGTRKRAEGEKDEIFKKELHSSTKEIAEHTMIVDLERNDMGKICEYGTVKVKDFAYVERYSHVQHLVSTIQGKLDEDRNFCDVIKAMHPGGTITGCPKRETCKIISELEIYDRGIYTGALGHINSKGDMDINILIRTIYAYNGMLETQAGGGIVLDSIPEREYKETIYKAQAQFKATNGILIY